MSPLLEKAKQILFEKVRPRATEIDRDLSALQQSLLDIQSEGLLGLRVPKSFGGLEFPEKDFRLFQEAAARCSGAFAFLEAQHQSGCSFLVKSGNEALKKKYLPQMATGEIRSGIAFSQLRKEGDPFLRAEPHGDGYVLNGRLPWVTGWGIFDICMTAAKLPDGKTLFVRHDLAESSALQASDVLKLAAVEITQTVSITIKDLRIEPEDVLYVRPADWIQKNDRLNVALQSPLALGCAAAGIDVVRERHPETADRLLDELDTCRKEVYAAMDDSENFEMGLHARAWAIELAGRCAHAGVVASSGAGNSMEHPAQRVYREALAFSVLSLNKPIQDVALIRLSVRT